jgi:peroxiredoxin family protein
VATSLMQQTIANNGVASIEELRSLSQEAGVKFVACQMTVELFGFSHDDFVEGMDYAGAATFLPVAQKSDVCLFI